MSQIVDRKLSHLDLCARSDVEFRGSTLFDQVRLLQFGLDGTLEGPINATAPHPVTVDTFAKALGRALGRPAVAEPSHRAAAAPS